MPFFVSLDSFDTRTLVTVALVVTAFVLMAADALLHRSPALRLEMARVKSIRELHQRRIPIRSGAKAEGCLAGSMPFLWTWCLVAAAFGVSGWLQHWAADAVIAVFVAGRFRALQEIGHFGIHGSLCRDRRAAFWVTEVFCQWPLSLTSTTRRWHTHIVEHHPNPNSEDIDPAIRDFKRIGFVPGISRGAFWRCVLYPFTPRGISDRLRSGSKNFVHSEASGWTTLARQLTMVTVLAGAYAAGGWHAIVVFALASVLVYPLFAWWSVVVEHRWFVGEHRASKREHELMNGRPTDYFGLSGWFFKSHVFPFGDCYHLAHSLYPMVRWNYLADLDRLLTRVDPAYDRYRSVGFLKPSGTRPSALSELRHRLCGGLGSAAAAEAIIRGAP